MNSLVFKNIRYVLMDIEGTTSDIGFVKNVLFPYSFEKLPMFLDAYADLPAVKKALQEVGAGDVQKTVAQLRQWIQDDVKHPILKELQGYIWKSGYENGDFRSHLYEDVLPTWERWKALGLRLGIYSSGSVQAQKQFFSHTQSGNLLPFLENHFDLEVGSKKETASYQEIVSQLKVPAKQILFLSDVPAELTAAQGAALQVVHVCRPGTKPESEFPKINSFTELDLSV